MLPLRVLAALMSTTSVLVAPAAAHAERLVTEDAVADAQSIRTDAEEEVFAPAPENTAADITTTVVAHGHRRLKVQVRYRDLAGTFPRAAYIKVRTPFRRFDIQTSRNTPEASTQLTRGQREDPVPCSGLRTSVDRMKEQLTVSVPTLCLDNPAWVQVGVLSAVAEVDVDAGSDEAYFVYFDDAHMTGGFEDHGMRVGPRVYPGA